MSHCLDWKRCKTQNQSAHTRHTHTHTLSKRQASCHCCLATVGATEPNPRGGKLMLNKAEWGERKEIFGRDVSLAGAGGGGGDVQVFISYFWMWWIFQFTYHTSFQSFFFFAFQLFGARFTDAFEMIKKNIFYCEIMLFPPLSNWICLSSVAQYPLDCSHTKPTRHNVISSSPIPHNSKKKKTS